MPEPRFPRPEDIPLSLLAEVRLAGTESYDLGCSLEPLLRGVGPFAARYAELETLEARYACWQLRELALEVEEGAPERVDDLLRWPYRTALAAVQGDDLEAFRYGRWTVVFRLLEACLEVTPRDPEHGRQLATLARHCFAHLDEGAALPSDDLQHSFDGELLGELEALIWAHLGNCYRAVRNLRQAARCFGRVRRLLKVHRAEIPGLRSAALFMMASLLRDQRKLAEARELIEEGLQFCRPGSEAVEARGMLVLASLDFEQGDAEAAVARMRSLLAKLDAAEHPRYHAEAHFNLAYYLTQSGEREAALRELRVASEQIGRDAPLNIQARFVGLEAAIHQRQGQLDVAIKAFRHSRQLFVQAGLAYDASVKGIEETTLLLQLGRTTEARDLALQLIPVFDDLDIERESRAAVELFRRATVQEQLTLVVTQQLLGALASRGSG